jgi:hypothetical protein
MYAELCSIGNLDELKTFLENNPNINISWKNELPFGMACHYGHLEVAKWLLHVKPDINISADDEFAFRWACLEGHLDVAKWLLQIKPNINISAKEDFAFTNACIRKKLKIAMWLLSLKPYLYVIEYDYYGKYFGFKIRSKEEANWEKRKYALHLAIHDNTNLLYHLPIDIVKAVTLFV